MSRRRNYASSELDELQHLKQENAKLKRELGKLRKQISKFDLDRFQSFKEALDRLDEIEMEQSAKRKDKQVSKDKWKCWGCEDGTLRIVLFDRFDGQHYFRKCEGCKRRTRMKKYEPGKVEE